MICAISGETPEEPVISKKSGHVFEKRVIEKYLRENDGKDPITHEAMSSEDLLPIKVNKAVKPRPPTATSIPGLLHTFQNEWDALMLETYTLKQQLDSVRQELAHSLYQHDAATRVIARLIKERDEARAALSEFQSQLGKASQASSEMEVEQTTGLPEEVASKISTKAQELSKSRKTKAIPETLATIEDIKAYNAISSHNLHSASPAGVLCVDLHPSHEERIVTGGNDHNIIVFNRSTSKVLSTVSGHSKKVTGVLFHPTQDVILSTSADKTARIWKKHGAKEYTSAHVVKVHKGEVSGCSLHATGNYWATGSADKTWAFLDIETATSLAQVDVDSPVHCVQFHPDGLLLGSGSADSCLKIWDVKSLKNAATFQVNSGAVIDVAFSENGYYLATASEDNTVKLWDLRKRKNFHTFDLPKDFNLSSVSWDHSGSYLAASGTDIRIFVGKTLNHMATFSGHSGLVTDVKWGKDAHFLASTSMDRSLKFWGKK